MCYTNLKSYQLYPPLKSNYLSKSVELSSCIQATYTSLSHANEQLSFFLQNYLVMKNPYIFSIEESIKTSVKKFENAIKIDCHDIGRYKASPYKKAKVVEIWEQKLDSYLNAYNEIVFLFDRAILVDHERSTYLKQIKRLENDVKKLSATLRIVLMTKQFEIEEQVKYKTEQQIKKLCQQAEDELQKELEIFKQAGYLHKESIEGRVTK